MSLGKPTIKLVFMDDDMRDYAINEATKALETSNSEKVRPPGPSRPPFPHNHTYQYSRII